MNKAYDIGDMKRRRFTMQYVLHQSDNNTWGATGPEPKRVQAAQ